MVRLNTRIRSAGSDPPETLPTGTLKSLLGERRLRKVLDMIDTQPSRSVSELALEVHLSPAHLQRLFKQKTGLQVSHLIGERRLQEATRLLCTSDLTIKEIAHTVGYQHHSSFVRAFHRRFALSPKYYREQQCNAAADETRPVERPR